MTIELQNALAAARAAIQAHDPAALDAAINAAGIAMNGKKATDLVSCQLPTGGIETVTLAACISGGGTPIKPA
jgi:hypothetical protein